MFILLKKIAKWTAIVLGVVVLIPVTIGLLTRALIGDVPPAGKRYDVGGVKLHLDCKGDPNHLPTVIVEGGAASASPNYYWLQRQLQDRVQVCRYDRAGLGWSDDSTTSRDAETISGELHALLAAAEVEPPYIIAGHSLGGALMRVFADRYPDEVDGLVFIDSSHPDMLKRMGMSGSESYGTYRVLRVLGELGLLPVIFDLSVSEATADDLPDSELQALRWMGRNGRMGKEAYREIKQLADVLERAGETTDFGSMPIRVFTAGEPISADAAAAFGGGDVKMLEKTRLDLQRELADLSSNGRHFTVEGATHTSICTNRRYARLITDEIHRILDDIERSLSRPAVETSLGNKAPHSDQQSHAEMR